jgi:hypothetical protein
MGDAAKISPRVPSTSAQNAIPSILIIRDCKAMGDAGKISPRVPSTCAQNATLSLLLIHIIPSHQIYVASDNPSLVPSVSCLTTSSYHWNYVRAADDVSQVNTCKATSAGAYLTSTKFEAGSKLPEFSGIVVSARAKQYSKRAPSSFRSLILNSHCSCHRSRPFSVP